jgi:hypothetical protein
MEKVQKCEVQEQSKRSVYLNSLQQRKTIRKFSHNSSVVQSCNSDVIAVKHTNVDLGPEMSSVSLTSI